MDKSPGDTHHSLEAVWDLKHRRDGALNLRFSDMAELIRKARRSQCQAGCARLTICQNFSGETAFSGKLGGMTTASLTDEALMQLYCEGDLLAFKELYQRHRLGLYRFISWRSPRQEWVDEIVQDSWASLHAARSQYQALAGFRTYLYQIARNRLIDLLRQKEVLCEHDQELDEHGITLESTQESTPLTRSPERMLDKKQQADHLHAAIKTLPNEQREALVLQQFNGMSLEEIAAITAVSTETVKSRLRYAMQKLRAQLHSQTEGEPA